MNTFAMSSSMRLRQLMECEDNEADGILEGFAACWCGFSSEKCLLVLTQKRSLSFYDAYSRMTAAGFRTGYWLFTKATLNNSMHLTLADFELAFTLWENFDNDIKSILSVRFISFWQSREGAGVASDALLKLKLMWEHTPPTQARRLEPSRALGLGWTQEQTVSLLNSHVDLNGDTQAPPHAASDSHAQPIFHNPSQTHAAHHTAP